MSWPSVMVVRLRNTDMSTTTQHPRGRQYVIISTRHASVWDAEAVLWDRRRCHLRASAEPKCGIRPASFHIVTAGG
jgi:hypothetical protein